MPHACPGCNQERTDSWRHLGAPPELQAAARGDPHRRRGETSTPAPPYRLTDPEVSLVDLLNLLAGKTCAVSGGVGVMVCPDYKSHSRFFGVCGQQVGTRAQIVRGHTKTMFGCFSLWVGRLIALVEPVVVRGFAISVSCGKSRAGRALPAGQAPFTASAQRRRAGEPPTHRAASLFPSLCLVSTFHWSAFVRSLHFLINHGAGGYRAGCR